MGYPDPAAGPGQPGFDSIVRLMDSGRCWVKLIAYRFDRGSAPYELAKPFVERLYKAAPDRVVRGMDWPHPGDPNVVTVPNDAGLVDTLSHWFENDAAGIAQVTVDNPAAIYGF